MMKTKNTLLLALLFLAAACSKDEETTALSDDEAAEMVATSLAVNSGGLALVVDESITETDDAIEASSGGRTASCGYSNSASFSAANVPGALITYAYQFSYAYELSCGLGEEPQSFVAEMEYSGQLDAPRLSSTHAGNGDLSVTELDESATYYAVNGTYDRSGSFQSKIRNQASSTSTLTWTIDGITVDKNTRKILSGSSTVVIEGVVPSKGEFSFTASVVFNGDNTVNVTIRGNLYIVDLTTGTVTEG